MSDGPSTTPDSESPSPNAGSVVPGDAVRADPLRTRLVDLLGCEYPIVQTGMGWVSGANLTAATSAAGGIGILAAVTMTADQLRDAVHAVKDRTDAPFGVTAADEIGVDDFCQSCRICEDACPPEALFQTKQTVRGEQKWYVDFDKCIPFFNQHQGCATCIAVCPWSRPGVGPRLAEKLARRADRLAEE